MVRKLTAWKTIAVKDATYAVAKENSLKKYLLKVTEVRPQRETLKCDIFWWSKTCHDKFSIIILNVFRFTKKSITK